MESHGIEPIGRDFVPRKGSPHISASGGLLGRVRIVDGDQLSLRVEGLRKIAGPLESGWHGIQIGFCLTNFRAVEGKEEKGFVVSVVDVRQPHWAADRAAVLIENI